MNPIEVYRKLCVSKNEIGLFQSAVWLDAIVPNSWGVALAIKGDQVLGAMPYFYKRKMGFKIITMPALTPYMGPVLFYPPGQKPATRLSFEKDILSMLIEKLPKTDKFIQYFPPTFKNGLPFQWSGYEQSVRYTYVIEDTNTVDHCWEGLQGNIRRAIKKAKKNFSLEGVNDSSELFRILTADYKEKALELDLELDVLGRVSQDLRSKGIGKTLVAKDDRGQIISSCIFGWDNQYLHYIAGAIDPKHRNSGALSLLLWHGIQLASKKGLKFNFEGGMFESIEKYFRGFGAEPMPYFQISKVDSKLLNLI